MYGPSTRKNVYAAPLNERSGARVLQDRLQETLILVLHENGNREYQTMSLRSLYANVMKVVTSRKDHSEEKEDLHTILDKEVHSHSHSQLEQDEFRSIIQNQQGGDTTICHPKTQPQNVKFNEPSTTLSNSLHDKNERLAPGETQSLQKEPPTTFVPRRIRPPRSRTSRGVSITHQTATYRERLGGYLHPRDMRRLVTPFSSSNEPELIVRRHVILLNFDPLRAIVLRDRTIVLVPDGADSILNSLERRVRGGIQELENQVFGDHIFPSTTSYQESRFSSTSSYDDEEQDHLSQNQSSFEKQDFWDECDDIDNRKWMIELPFELIAVDAILQSVCSLLFSDAAIKIKQTKEIISVLSGENNSNKNQISFHVAQEKLRIAKDEVKEMENRVLGFVRAMNMTLDEDEDMALMNLSRLISHPHRFIQPVSPEILEEESDEPELILEAFLQQALSIENALELIKHKITTTEDLVRMKLDIVRNRLLLVNTVMSLISVCITCASLVGSIFGMNLINHFENSETAFVKVVVGTLIGSVLLLVSLGYIFHRAGSMPVSISGL